MSTQRTRPTRLRPDELSARAPAVIFFGGHHVPEWTMTERIPSAERTVSLADAERCCADAYRFMRPFLRKR